MNQVTNKPTYVFERGGSTASRSVGSEQVAYFAYCAHCDLETPVDNQDTCTYCFHQVSDDADE
jgi:hypothetical protein